MSVDYRYTHTGQETARKYADIINLPRPQMKYQRMDPVKRAKIFAPFDAPRSIEPTTEAVKEKANQVERIYLSEGQRKELSEKMLQVRKGYTVTVRYFIPETSTDKGRYTDISGMVKEIEPYRRFISLYTDKTGIPLDKPTVKYIALDDVLDIMIDKSMVISQDQVH